MIWKIVISDRAKKQLSKLDNQIKSKILNFFNQEEIGKNPKFNGKILLGNLNGLWRYIPNPFQKVEQFGISEIPAKRGMACAT